MKVDPRPWLRASSDMLAVQRRWGRFWDPYVFTGSSPSPDGGFDCNFRLKHRLHPAVMAWTWRCIVLSCRAHADFLDPVSLFFIAVRLWVSYVLGVGDGE